jgi:triacylglycerol lipase
MLARIQQLIVASLIALQVAAVVTAIILARPWYAATVPALVVLGYVTVLAVEFLILRGSYDRDDPLRPSHVHLIAAWIGEIFAAPRAFLWRQPFFARAIPDDAAASSQARRGVVLVHGFFCNRGLWNPWLRRLQQAHIPFIAVNLEPVFGSINDYRDTIEAAVETLRQATSLAPIVVAHSMGGLAVRAWLATAPDASQAHRIVTIASPHAGTSMARRGYAANVAEMRVGSAWLSDLRSREPASTRSRFICFWSHCDNIVFPTRSAMLAEADNRHLEATAHVQMVLHPAVIEAVLELVNPAPASRG